MVTVGQRSLWDRWKDGVGHGWGNLPGNVWKGITGGGVSPPTVHNGGVVPNSPAAHAEGAVVDVGHFLGKLTEGSTWVRVGEVAVGGLLLIAGIDHIFGTNYTGKIAKAAPYMMV